MKPLFTLITILTLVFQLHAQHLTFLPEKPAPGEAVTFRYDPADTPLKGSDKVYATALLFSESETPEAIDVDMQPAGAFFTGALATSADAKALFIKLENESGELSDNNKEQGYWAMFYQAGRQEPVQGAYASMAQAVYSYSFYTGIKRSPEQALDYLRQEFQLYPASKLNARFATDFAGLAAQNKDEKALGQAKAIATELAGSKKATEDELNQAYYMYQRMKEETLAKELGEKIQKKYPNGNVAGDELFSRFYEEKDLARKEALFETFKKQFAKNKNFAIAQNNYARILANSSAARGDWGKFTHYLSLISDRQAKASILNSQAWDMAGEGLEGEAGGLEMAGQLSSQSLELIKECLSNLDEGRNSFFSPRYWKNILESNYGMYSDTYAVILYRQGAIADALHYQAIACENSNFSDGELNERYAIYYEKAKGRQAAEARLAQFIREGTATSNMKEQHKRLFLANNSLEDAYELYAAELEKAALEKLREETRRKMIDEDAPDFTLLNLDGREVKLSSLRGKTVVLDFWATWCGPCKASFPGMQRAVNHFKDNADVVFLFIDTWENDGDKEKNAADFISSHEYTFEVLMDNDSKVVSQFGVRGIPTKFVIGPDGRIRFKSVGFGGNDEELLTEVKTMVEVAAAEGRKTMP